MAVMALGIRHGQTINVEIDGTDEKTAGQKRYGSFLRQNCEAETKSMEIIKGKFNFK